MRDHPGKQVNSESNETDIQPAQLLPQNTRLARFCSDDLKIIKQAVSDAQKLPADPKCDEALKAYKIDSLSALLNGLIFEGPNANTFDGRNSSGLIAGGNKSSTVAQYAKSHKEEFGAFTQGPPGEKGSVLFLSYYFFDPPKIDWVRTQRAIILFHEAVHQVGNRENRGQACDLAILINTS